MSLFESRDSNGQVSLGELLEGKDVSGSDDHDIDDIAYLICRG
jgi:hypothetical protein